MATNVAQNIPAFPFLQQALALNFERFNYLKVDNNYYSFPFSCHSDVTVIQIIVDALTDFEISYFLIIEIKFLTRIASF